MLYRALYGRERSLNLYYTQIEPKDSWNVNSTKAVWRQETSILLGDYCCGLVVSNYVSVTKAGHDLFFPLKKKKKNREKYVPF